VVPPFERLHTLTYGLGFLLALPARGWQPGTSVYWILGGLFALANGGAVLVALPATRREEALRSRHWLALLFFFSGISALIYQVTWQRVLFSSFGANIESVTVIVTIFMLGLGLGSLFGGWLSRLPAERLPGMFLACELFIGAFGLVSLPLIRGTGLLLATAPLPVVTLVTAALLLPPTLMMGATLPILVQYLYGLVRHMSRTVGLLYFVNTLGSAFACYFAADVLFTLAGQQVAVVFAALCNAAVGLLVFDYSRRVARPPAGETPAPEPPAPVEPRSAGAVSFPLVLLLSGLSGYFSLSQEIVWVHAISYTTGSKPRDFAHVLGAFLLGIAVGSLLSQRVGRRAAGSERGLVPVALAFVGAGIFAYLTLPLLGRACAAGGEQVGVWVAQLFVLVIALVSGFSFPLLCHAARGDGRRAGVTLSLVYFANIAGAVFGPLFTTFVLMDHLPLDRLMWWIAIGTVGTGALALLVPGARRGPRLAVLATAAAFVLVALLAHAPLYAQLLERLHYKKDFAQARPYKHLVETRSGIVAVANDGQDTVYGGGVYDGRFNIDPFHSTNLIQRAYAIAILHPNPERMLEIGLASGSWTRVALAYPRVKRMDVVEINPGYLDVIRHFPEQEEILGDPRVTIHIDDGRRWLNRHPDERFDFILMNTSFYWRNHSTNLLSREMLELCKRHLRPGGVLYYNATQSAEVFYTAAQVFPVVTRMHNFVVASEVPFALDEETRRKNLLSFAIEGRPVFDLSRPEARAMVDQLATWPLPDEGPRLRRRSDLWAITDDNMAIEFRGPRGFRRPASSWTRVWDAVVPALAGD